MGNNVGTEMIKRMDQMEKERLARMPDILATTKGESQIQELSKEVNIMSVPNSSEPMPGPMQAVAVQSNILDRIKQAVINISGRLEFVRKIEDQKSGEVKPDWGPNPNMSELANAQAKLVNDMESVSDILNNLYESIDV